MIINSQINYKIILKTFNTNWLLYIKKTLKLPMEIKKFSVVSSVITSKHAKDQYEIRCFITIFLKNITEYSKIISPLLFERILYVLLSNNKYQLKLKKIEKNWKF